MAGQGSTYLRVGQPNWLAEQYSADLLIPGGARVNPAVFPGSDAVRVTATAAAAVDAVAVTVAAVTRFANAVPIAVGQVVIPAGSIIDFGAKKLAVVTANVVYGATSIAVRALGTAIAANDVGLFLGLGDRYVPSGTLLGRTFAERDTAALFEPYADGDEEVYLTLWDSQNLEISNEVDLLRHTTLIKENWLTTFAALTALGKAAVRARYQLTIGAPSVNPNA